jgi:hypothetical protein
MHVSLDTSLDLAMTHRALTLDAVEKLDLLKCVVPVVDEQQIHRQTDEEVAMIQRQVRLHRPETQVISLDWERQLRLVLALVVSVMVHLVCLVGAVILLM